MDPKVNVVLVHGAWAGGSCWSKVISLLEAKGYHVSAAADTIDLSRRRYRGH